jgi:hypothetical protein
VADYRLFIKIDRALEYDGADTGWNWKELHSDDVRDKTIAIDVEGCNDLETAIEVANRTLSALVRDERDGRIIKHRE